MDASDSNGTFSQTEIAFYLQTHEHLRREIEADKDHLRKLNVYVVVGTGTVWSWIATRQGSPPTALMDCITFIPLLFAVFGAIQSRGLVKSIRIKAAYLRTMESKLTNLECLEGWETWLDGNRGKYPHHQDLLFWVIILLVTLVLPCLYLIFKPE